jgi:hypothetical protein
MLHLGHSEWKSELTVTSLVSVTVGTGRSNIQRTTGTVSSSEGRVERDTTEPPIPKGLKNA